MVGASPGQGGHQFSALNAAEEGPDLGAISISYQTVCVGVPMYHSLQTIGACVPDLAGKIWALAACWITLASNGDCLHEASQGGEGKSQTIQNTLTQVYFS